MAAEVNPAELRARYSVATWKPKMVNINTPGEIGERQRLFDGLDAVGLSSKEICPICQIEFGATNEVPEYTTSSNNRLFSCGTPGSRNKHVFHEFCLAHYCSDYLLRHQGQNKVPDWDKSGVPCPICREPIGDKRVRGSKVQVMYRSLLPPANIVGGKRRKNRKSKKVRRTKKIRKSKKI